MYSITRQDAKKLAKQVEMLAKKVQKNLGRKGDFLTAANELVRNSTTMVFALGELYASEQLEAAQPKKVVHKVSKPRAPRTYYRDKLGRFASKP